jgi:hydroxymethylbilane synthase
MESIARARPELSLHLVTMKSRGDLFPDLPLEGENAKSLFTGVLEQALLDGKVDLCVHSLKDMGETQDERLPIVGMAKRGDPRDLLVLPAGGAGSGADSGANKRNAFTPAGFVPWPVPKSLSVGGPDPSLPVGCSSLRRRAQFSALAPELSLEPVRGNVPTRLAKLDSGQYGALILAAAGIERLGLTSRGGYFFSLKEMVPAAGQGVLAIQGHRGEDYPFLESVRDPLTEEEALAERTLIRALGCGCGSPAAAHARIRGGEIALTAMYGAEAGSPLFVEELSGERHKALPLAEELARLLLSRGQGR